MKKCPYCDHYMNVEEINDKNGRWASCTNCDYRVTMKKNAEQMMRTKLEKKGW